MKGGDTATQGNMLLGVEKEKITAIEPWAEGTWSATKVLRAPHAVIMPGLINAHTHLPMSLFRGLADDLSFDDWLLKNILPLEARVVNPEFVRVGTELSLLEMIAAGTTCMAEMFYFDDEIAEVVDQAGMRALVGESILDFAVPDNKNLDGSDFRIMDKLFEKYQRHERIRPSIAPHSPYTCGDETLKKVLSYAQKKDIPIQIHVSETQGEWERSLKEHGMSPLARLKKLGYLDHPALFAHCVHLDEADTKLLAKSQASPVYNPESNMKLSAGAAPIRRYLDHGIKVAIGTDSAASNNDLNLFKEMDCGCKMQKLVNKSTTALTAPEALRMATLDGAHALGLADKVGSLEIGKLADFIAVDLRAPHMQPLHSIASQLVYAANGSEVQHVVCHGKILFEDRQYRTLDPAAVLQRVHDHRKKAAF